MKDDLKYIDEFYKKNLDGIEVEAGNESWKKLKWALFWMRYKWIIGFASIIVILGLGSLALFNITDNSVVINDAATDKLELTSELTTDINGEPTLLRKNEISIIEEEVFAEQPISSNEKLPSQFMAPSNESSVLIENNESDIFNQEDSNFFIYDDKAPFSAMSSLGFETDIAIEPDSSLLGYNRRDDILPPGKKKQWLSLNIYAGPSFSESEISDYELKPDAWRNSNELNSLGWSVGSDLKLHIKNWIITTGVNYSVYNQNSSYSKTYLEYSPDNSYFDYDTTWVWIFDAPDFGKPRVKSIDSSWVEVYDDVTSNQSGFNQLKYFEIPILIGYRFSSNMFTFELNAGTSVGFLVYSNIMDVSSLSSNLGTVDDSQMNKSMINFIANASLYYHLNRKTSLFVSPYYKQNLNSVFKETYPVKQQYKTFGINFGVNILF